MNLKQFLKPDWKKIVLFITLFLISSSYEIFGYKEYGSVVSEFHAFGLPIPFYSCVTLEIGSHTILMPFVFNSSSGCNISYELLIPNLIFWYIVSCLLIWFFDRIRKKKK